MKIIHQPNLITRVTHSREAKDTLYQGDDAGSQYLKTLEREGAKWPDHPRFNSNLFGIEVPQLDRDIDIREFQTESGIWLRE